MNRALIVIDVQESFRQRPSWQTFNNPQIVDQVNRLVESVRADGGLVAWVLHSEPGTGTVFDPVNGFVRFMDGLKPADDEPQVVKTSHNAFTTTNLQQVLTMHGIGEVVICGIRTEQCCETTARVAADLGYEVVFVSDATATNPIEHRDAPAGRTFTEIAADPRTLSAEEVVARTEYSLHGRFARISSVAELTGT
ncbi:MAG TPA: isochorismatase family protein [Micromonosporaceae bacterium]